MITTAAANNLLMCLDLKSILCSWHSELVTDKVLFLGPFYVVHNDLVLVKNDENNQKIMCLCLKFVVYFSMDRKKEIQQSMIM